MECSKAHQSFQLSSLNSFDSVLLKVFIYPFFITPEQPLFCVLPTRFTFFVAYIFFFYDCYCINMTNRNNTFFSWYQYKRLQQHDLFLSIPIFKEANCKQKLYKKNIFVNKTIFTILQIQIVSFKSRII